MTTQMRMGEFFSGPGGIAKGAAMAASDPELAGLMALRHEWAVDIDSDSCETYKENITIPKTRVHTIDAREAAERIADFPDIDGFSFGFPCNDFSLVGERRGLDGKYGPLYSTGIQVLRVKRPQWFLAENVSGLRSANNGVALKLILQEMKDTGYRVTPHLYRFEDYGVPQRRHRVIIVGIRDDLGLSFRVPKPTHGDSSELDAYKTAGETLSRPMPKNVTNNERVQPSPTVEARLKLIDPGENAFNAKRMTDDLRLNVKGATLSHIYRRLTPQAPSYTITAAGGGGTHVYHWEEDRALTNRERARLQSFPDKFVFHGGLASVRKQIGMAVPPVGAKAIFTALFKTMLGIDYDSIPPCMKAQPRTAPATTSVAPTKTASSEVA